MIYKTCAKTYIIENKFKELPFLDIRIKNQNGCIITGIY